MWHNLFTVDVRQLMDQLAATDITFAEKVVRTVAVYALLMLLLRMAGKRALAWMNTMDLVVIFLLANVVQNAVIGNDNSLWGGAIGAVTLVVVNTVVNRLAVRFPRLEKLLLGTPTTLISNGEIDKSTMFRYGVAVDELEHAVRLQSGDSVSDVETGELTPNGQLVLTLKESARGASHGDVEEILARLSRIEGRLSHLH